MAEKLDYFLKRAHCSRKSSNTSRSVGLTLFQGRFMFLPSARPLPTHWLSDSGRWGQKEPCSYLWTLKYRTLQHRQRDGLTSLIWPLSVVFRRGKSSLPGVFLEQVLDALTMMNIPVHYEHSDREKTCQLHSPQDSNSLYIPGKENRCFMKRDKVRSDTTSYCPLFVSLFYKLNYNRINQRSQHQVFIYQTHLCKATYK